MKKQILSVTVIFAMLLSFISTGFARVSANTGFDISKFSPYYSANLSTADPAAESLSAHWGMNSDGTMLVRNGTDSNWAQNCKTDKAILYYNVKEYGSFDMTVDFKAPGGNDGANYSAYFGFGAESVGSNYYNDASAYVYTMHRGGIITGGRTANNWIGMKAAADVISGWNIERTHKLRVRAVNKSVTFWIDGVEMGSVSVADYEGGYIFFAGDDYFVGWGMPQIKEITPMNTSKFTAYYTANAKTNENMTAESIEKHWDTSEEYLNRNFADVDWSNGLGGLSVLYFNEKKYKNFELTVKYKTYSISSEKLKQGDFTRSTIVGFGAADMAKSFMYDKNSFAVNISCFGAVLSADSKSWLRNYALNGNVENWNNIGYHTLKMRVENGKVGYWIDGNFIVGIVTGSKDPGYIFFGSGEGTTQFGIPTVTELGEPEISEDAKQSPLYKKSALFIGDSISYGALDDYLGMSWGGRIGEKYGMNWKNASVSGATVKYTSVNGSPLPYIKNQLTDGEFDYVIVEGGINDAMRGNPLGKISDSFKTEDFDTDTFAGSLEELLSAVKSKYPNAKVGYIVTMQVTTQSAQNTAAYYEVAKQICDKWNVDYLDLFNDAEVTGWFVENQKTYLPDTLHPNAAGYELLTPKIAGFAEKLRAVVKYDADNNGVFEYSADLAFLKKALLGAPNINITKVCDTNGDSCINISDLVHMKKAIAEVTDKN